MLIAIDLLCSDDTTTCAGWGYNIEITRTILVFVIAIFLLVFTVLIRSRRTRSSRRTSRTRSKVMTGAGTTVIG